LNFDFLKNLKLDEAIIFFTGGKDSIASLDLIRPYINNLIGIYLEYIPGLKFKDNIFKYYEERYNFKIIKRPHPQWFLYQINKVYGIENKIEKKIKKIDLKLGKFYKLYKNELNIKWSILGEKRSDDITRARKIYKTTPIDKENNIIYPVAYFSDKEIFKYIKQKKLILPKEYYETRATHEMNTPFSKDSLLYFKENFYEDYEKIINIFPQIEGILYE
jgi:sulfate adenylyltransferase subunit 2